MKPILLLLLFFPLLHVEAQVAINSDGAAPHASAMLEVTSTGSGVLIPRMTAAQRDAIPTPATGLMVYVINDNLFHYYNGSAWVAINPAGGAGSGQWDANGDHISNNNPGRVGIGTSAPDALLHVSSSDAGESNAVKITQGAYNSLMYHNEDGDLVLRKRNQVDQLVLDSDGRVGVGTTNVTAQLHVHGGAAGDEPVLQLTQTNGTSGVVYDATAGFNDLGQLVLHSGGSLPQFVLDPTGNVGVGTTNEPSARLEIHATSSGQDSGLALSVLEPDSLSVKHARMYFDGDGDLFIEAESNFEQLSLRQDGSVIINPAGSEQFRVDGDTRILGDVEVNGSGNFDDEVRIQGTVKIAGGSPANGRVLTSDADGDATWKDPSLGTGAIPVSTIWKAEETDTGDTDIWKNVGPKGTLTGVKEGDRILFLVSFRGSLNGNGSGGDRYKFRINLTTDESGSYSQQSNQTGNFGVLHEHRDWGVPISFQRMVTIGTGGTGTLRYQLQVVRDGDDPLYIKYQEMSAINLR